MKNIIYGYARISTMKQKLERQIDNIKRAYPGAIIVTESYTGTKIDRPAFTKLVEQAKADTAKGAAVTIVFDEVSRMSRNAEEGFSLYRELFDQGINLIFLKEPHLNTENYREALKEKVSMTGTDVDIILEAVNKYLMQLAKRQIVIAFEQAQAEVDYLHVRTAEGIQKAREAGKQIGRAEGATIGVDFKESKKATAARDIIRKHCRDFGGNLTDAETMKLAGVARNSYYKYKKQLREQLDA